MRTIAIFVLSLLVGCAASPGPSDEKVSKGIQEGIGGDIAAFYVKAVTVASLPGSLAEIGGEYTEVENGIRSARIHGAENLGALFKKSNGIVFVDRDRLKETHICLVASKLLRALELPSLELKLAGCFNVHGRLEDARDAFEEKDLATFVKDLNEKTRLRGCPKNRQMRASEQCHAAKDFLASVEPLAAATKVQNSQETLFDQNPSIAVDAITKLATAAGAEVLVNPNGQLGSDFYAPIKNLFLLHELNHVQNPDSLPDRHYAISQELFAVWLQTNM